MGNQASYAPKSNGLRFTFNAETKVLSLSFSSSKLQLSLPAEIVSTATNTWKLKAPVKLQISHNEITPLLEGFQLFSKALIQFLNQNMITQQSTTSIAVHFTKAKFNFGAKATQLKFYKLAFLLPDAVMQINKHSELQQATIKYKMNAQHKETVTGCLRASKCSHPAFVQLIFSKETPELLRISTDKQKPTILPVDEADFLGIGYKVNLHSKMRRMPAIVTFSSSSTATPTILSKRKSWSWSNYQFMLDYQLDRFATESQIGDWRMVWFGPTSVCFPFYVMHSWHGNLIATAPCLRLPQKNNKVFARSLGLMVAENPERAPQYHCECSYGNDNIIDLYELIEILGISIMQYQKAFIHQVSIRVTDIFYYSESQTLEFQAAVTNKTERHEAMTKIRLEVTSLPQCEMSAVLAIGEDQPIKLLSNKVFVTQNKLYNIRQRKALCDLAIDL